MSGQVEEYTSEDEILKAARLIAALRAENSALCSNFGELQELYTRLQANHQESIKKLAEQKKLHETLSQKYITEKQELHGQLAEREREVLRIRSEGLQKSDFQKLQLRIREELEAPYNEIINDLKVTTEEQRIQKERAARERMQEQLKNENIISSLRSELELVKSDYKASQESWTEEVKALRNDKGRIG